MTRYAATVPLWLAPADDADEEDELDYGTTVCITPAALAAMLEPAPRALPPGAVADLPAEQRVGGHVVGRGYMGRVMLAGEDERARRAVRR